MYKLAENVTEEMLKEYRQLLFNRTDVKYIIKYLIQDLLAKGMVVEC